MEIISKKEAKELGLKRYFTGKPCKHGHTSERYTHGDCIECAKSRAKSWKQENREVVLESQKSYYYDRGGKQKQRDSYRNKYSNDMDFAEKERRKHRQLYRKHTHYRENAVKRNREFIANNPMIAFTRSSLQRMERGVSIAKYEDLLGYQQVKFIAHMESQFKDGMTWDNRSEWHIDHIKPIKAFLDEGITDPAVINALDNLQPLWAHENLSKGAKWEMENIKCQ